MPIDLFAASAVGATAWLWEQFGKDITGNVTGSIQEKWRGFHNRRSWQKAAEAYKKALIRDHSTIRILGISSPVSLEGIFTDVYVLDKVTAQQHYDIYTLKEQVFDRAEKYVHGVERINGLELILRETSHRLYILGKPGAGKSTFLRHLVLQAIKGEIDKIPIFISLKDWSTKSMSLMEYIVHQFSVCQFPDAFLFVETILSNGKAMVMFDGLDEVNVEDDLRKNITIAIDEFCRKNYKSQCIITCRIAASDYAFQNFQDVEIADFTEEQIRYFVGKWFSDQAGADNELKRKMFLDKFFSQENRAIRELGNIPILLTLLCIAFDDTMQFPRRRGELYEEAIDALIRKWDSFRSIKRDEIYKGLSNKLKHRLFSYVAAKAFEAGEQFFEERKLAQEIEGFFERLPEIDRQGDIDGLAIIKAIEAQHSIFIERAKGVYSFSHLTFQEYFTAKYIADNEARGAIERLVTRHFTDPRWREVTLITSSLLDDAERFFKLMQEQLDLLAVTDEKLLALLAWLDQKCDHFIPKYHFKTRLRYLFIFILCELVKVQNFKKSKKDRGRASVSWHLSDVPQYGNNLGELQHLIEFIGENRDSFIDVDFYLYLPQVKDISDSADINFWIDICLVYLWYYARMRGNRTRVRSANRIKLNHVINLINQWNKQTGNFLLHINSLKSPNSKTVEGWTEFAETVERIIQEERAIALGIDINKTMAKNAVTYLRAAWIFAECLELAVVSDRDVIRSSFMRFPIK